MDLQLKGKRALVTAATAGIGLAIAKSLVAEGVAVVLTGRTVETLAVARAELPAEADVATVVCDVSRAEGAEILFGAVEAVDVLVNNLGIFSPKGFFEVSDEEWGELFETNVMSGVRLARHYLPGMLERNWGRVIFISSASAVQIPAEMIHYGMTKTAQLSISRGLAELTKGTGVTVNSVLPGPTESAGIVGYLKSMSALENPTQAEVEAEYFPKHRPGSLLQRLIKAEEVANLVTYVASPLSAATNGAALKVEGGLVRSIL